MNRDALIRGDHRPGGDLSIAAFDDLYGRPLHPAVQSARDAIMAEADGRRQAWNRVWRAVMVAPDLDTCRALLNGERVPLSRLDADWLARFALR